VTQVAIADFASGFEYPVNYWGLFVWTETDDNCMLSGPSRWMAFITSW